MIGAHIYFELTWYREMKKLWQSYTTSNQKIRYLDLSHLTPEPVPLKNYVKLTLI